MSQSSEFSLSAPTTSPVRPTRDRGLLMGIGLLVLLLVLNAGLTYYNTRQLHEAAGRVTQAHQVLDSLAAVISSAKDAETGQRGFVITGDPEFLEPYNQAVASIHRLVDDVERLIRNDAQQ